MHSFDTNVESFNQDVIEASHTCPVLVDFWAPWCNPCKSLIPVLMKIAEEYNGKFKLAKVNIDENKALAEQFVVQSVPAMKLFKDGKLVYELDGVQPEGQIKQLLNQFIEDKSLKKMAEALLRYNDGDKSAIADMVTILNAEPDNQAIRIQYVAVLMEEKQFDDAKMILEALPTDIKQTPEVSALLSRIGFMQLAENAPETSELQQKIESDPDDCDARYELGSIYLANMQYETAMQQFFEIMQRDRSFKDDIGRISLIKAFEMLGGSGELVSMYRRKMSLLLN